MSRLIFVNRFYWPDESATAQLLTDLAESLAKFPCEICVVTSLGPLPADNSSEQRHGVEIFRVGPSPTRGKHILHRLCDYFGFSAAAVWRIGRMQRPNDIVIYMTDPPMLAIWLHLWMRWRQTSYFHWVQDVYPEIAATLTGHRWLNLMRPLRNLSWRRAAACVALDQDMAQVIRSAGVPANKIRLIPNWAPAGLVPPPAADVEALRRRWVLNGKFVVLYSGNLGRAHDLEAIIEVADHLRNHEDILFVFVGDGAQLPILQHGSQSRGLTNVLFLPPQPRSQLSTTLAVGDVHFVTMRAGCEGLVFPSKLAGICAIGRPVIVIGPRHSNLVTQVERHGLGHGFSAKQIPAIAESILELKSDPNSVAKIAQQSRRYAAAHNLEHAVVQWTRLLNAEHGLAAGMARPQADR